MDTPHYVHINVPSIVLESWVFYYTIHIATDTPQHVHTDVPSEYLCP